MNRAVYNKGNYPDLVVAWDDSGVLIDLTGRTITLEVFVFGGPTLFTKTTGFTTHPPVLGVVPNPNLTVVWSTTPGAELDSLEEGQYVLKFTDDLQREMFGELVIRFNAPNFGYCEKGDLLLGDLTVSARVNKYDFVNSAADEMNGMIGQRYLLPLDLDAAPAWVTYKLKSINARLATGRLIQALGSAHEDNAVNDYGQHLIDSAMEELEDILNGSVGLPGLSLEPTSFQATAPSGKNHDATSAVDQFENMFMRPHSTVANRRFWQPGAAP